MKAEFAGCTGAAGGKGVDDGDDAIVFFGCLRQEIRAVNIAAAAALTDNGDVQNTLFSG